MKLLLTLFLFLASNAGAFDVVGSLPQGLGDGRYVQKSGDTMSGPLTVASSVTVTGNGQFNGNVGIGTTAPQAKLEVNGNIHSSGTISTNGFSKFGDLSTGVKLVVISTMTGNTQGDSTKASHGIAGSPVTFGKIVSATAVVNTGADAFPDGSVSPYLYFLDVDDTGVYVNTVAGSSANILNKTVKIMVWYIE